MVSIEKKRTSSRPPAPFITSTLQQGAASKLSMGAQRTMRVAQTLYEAGHITYMRTDSTNLSGEALTMVRGYVASEFGKNYLPEKPNFYASSNKSAQEAHEAIRPTDVNFTPAMAKSKLGADEFRVYQLIWNRFVACQMSPAEFDQTVVLIETATKSGKATFRAAGRKMVFDGYTRVAGFASDDQLLPELAERTAVYPIELAPTQHFTQPPARYTEASLVKALEQAGIGRPSTYASIISTIQAREYVAQVDRRFHATLLGKVVTDKLVQGFPNVMDVKFTARMESQLDEIEEKHADWVKLLRDFYGPFHASVDLALEKLEHAGGAPSDRACPKCGKGMLYRISKNGFFLACQDRECATTVNVDEFGQPKVAEVSEVKCPNCGRAMIKRKGRFGMFLGCSGYAEKNEAGEPACSTIIQLDKDGNPQPPKAPPVKTTVKCEKCGSDMLLRQSKRGPWLSCSAFPKCRSSKQKSKLVGADLAQVDALMPLLEQNTKDAAAMAEKITASIPAAAGSATKPKNVATDIDCDLCGKAMVVRSGKRGPFLGCSGYPKCKNTGEVPAKLLEELGLTASGQEKAEEGKSDEGTKARKPGGAKGRKKPADDAGDELPEDLELSVE